MNLYCKLPFGQLDHRTPAIVDLAARLRRTPSSVAMKLCNLASLDPAQQARGVAGLKGASAADRAVWAEFHADWERMAFESEQRWAALMGTTVAAELPKEESLRAGLERERLVRQRVNQGFFRAAVISAYASRCCITGLDVPELLVASHIVPWSRDDANRVNPRNGLCLNALHDAAFDRGLMTVTPALKVVLSKRLKGLPISPGTKQLLLEFDQTEIRLPDRFHPEAGFLDWHVKNVFQKS